MRLGLGLGQGVDAGPRSVPSQLAAIGWFRANAGVTTVTGKLSAISCQLTGLTLTQGTAGNRLTYTADYGDGAPAIESAATGWISGVSVMSLNSDFTLVGLARHAADSYWFSQNGVTVTTFKFGMRALTTIEAASTTNDAASTVEAVNGTSSANAWHVIVVRRSGATLKVRVGASSDVTATLAGTNTTTIQTIGASRSDGTNALNGAVREVQQYQSHLSDANVTAVIADIKARWPNVP